MRIILLIQSVIIIAGAYYIYTLRTSEPIAEEVVEETLLPDVTTSTSLNEEEAEVSTPVNTEIAPSAGPNDAGMEWPVFEGELESR